MPALILAAMFILYSSYGNKGCSSLEITPIHRDPPPSPRQFPRRTAMGKIAEATGSVR